ncbi:MAG TPA: hypothetical protein VII47_16750 [Actinomycetota bacterium]|jgi:hypothetical protein
MPRPAPAARTVLAALTACLAWLTACTSSRNAAPAPRPTTSSPARPASTPTGTASPVALSAAAIAGKLGCTEQHAGEKAASDPVAPLEAVDCTAGDVRYGIRTYRTNAERDQVLKAAPTDSGYRNVGEQWLVITSTEAAASTVLQKIGGTIVDTRYTTPGS